MGKRDLKADFEICNKATRGPWIEGTDLSEVIIQNAEGEEVLLAVWYDNVKWVGIREENLNLFLQAREGWPHAIERAIKAEKQLEELLAWEEPKEQCYLSAMRRIAELESLVRELVHYLDFMLGDKSTRVNWLVELGKVYFKAREVLRDE